MAYDLFPIGDACHRSSLGASTANALLAQPNAPTIDAWVPTGMPGAFSAAPKESVLDVVAEREIDVVRTSARGRIATLPKGRCSRQIVIAGADHNFEDRQKELVAAIAAFLGRAFSAGC